MTLTMKVARRIEDQSGIMLELVDDDGATVTIRVPPAHVAAVLRYGDTHTITIGGTDAAAAG